MHDQANPTIHPAEEGIYDLTGNDLTVAAEAVVDYILFTNNTQIKVTVEAGHNYSGEVWLWNADDQNEPVKILCGQVTPHDHSCTFTGLSASDRYMVTCDGNEELL